MNCRCGQPLDWKDDRALDEAERLYPVLKSHPICLKCFEALEMKRFVEIEATARGISPQSLLSEWLAKYE